MPAWTMNSRTLFRHGVSLAGSMGTIRSNKSRSNIFVGDQASKKMKARKKKPKGFEVIQNIHVDGVGVVVVVAGEEENCRRGWY